jgi:hypothetical protein
VVLLGIVTAWRFESGAWRKIDLLGRRRVAAGPAEPGADGAGVVPTGWPDPTVKVPDARDDEE